MNNFGKSGNITILFTEVGLFNYQFFLAAFNYTLINKLATSKKQEKFGAYIVYYL